MELDIDYTTVRLEASIDLGHDLDHGLDLFVEFSELRSGLFD